MTAASAAAVTSDVLSTGVRQMAFLQVAWGYFKAFNADEAKPIWKPYLTIHVLGILKTALQLLLANSTVTKSASCYWAKLLC